MTERTAWAAGLLTTTAQGKDLVARYPRPELGDPPVGAEAWPWQEEAQAAAGVDPERRVSVVAMRQVIDLDAAPATAADAYLRLHLLSWRLVEPNSVNLDGIFGVLETVVWTSQGPCDPDGFDQTRFALAGAGRGMPVVLSIDKFPRMVDYVIPSGVRIADADRVRLGAYLAPGTTVMHEGFVNFNAGTLGPSMVEGRVSQGVIVDPGADIGGGSSIMGTLSGGGKERIRVGPRSLLGANAGLGISLGADCIVEAGLYVTAGTKVRLLGGEGERVVKARELSGVDGLLFRRNSLSGAVEAVPRARGDFALNPELHAN
jgi:2,3,4,5-tetrahydropyridine-2-carboxylate N-succinyltransferase